MNPVVHFEMPAEDRKRMADFYTKVFGWKIQQLGEDMGNYVVATTTESDENGMPEVSSRKLVINRHNIPQWLSRWMILRST